jgi:hypothetical protein
LYIKHLSRQHHLHPEPDSEPDPKPDSEPDPKTDSEPDPKLDSEPASEPDLKPDPESSKFSEYLTFVLIDLYRSQRLVAVERRI